MGVLAGIITGLVGGAVYNRWSGIKLPDFFSFFGGKRFVPIATGFFCLVLAAIFGYVWPPVQHGIHAGGEWIVSAGALGSGIFGFINRLLIPTGLHQVLNTIAWFQIGEFTNAAGTVFHGDINRFYAGDGTAGMFMSGFFPIALICLVCRAPLWRCISPRRKNVVRWVGGMLLSVAITAFLDRRNRAAGISVYVPGAAAVPPARHFDRYQPVLSRRCWVSMRASLSRQARSTMF